MCAIRRQVALTLPTSDRRRAFRSPVLIMAGCSGRPTLQSFGFLGHPAWGGGRSGGVPALVAHRPDS